ncbi:hypothetical protein C0Q44_23215 [Paenibacillus sp. PCH8]|uniref:hypothetical protein n=1 Tax=Paenibacillus sp. PCH8 TaxID=2066524 RepID=UPI000CF9AC44|nr:hypothetical protein [Paenibacillus sp. PCH8]PQP81316.1 hypothetical protein C0Q44_23215 [Paenibacillus sp. PCH8]
MTYSQRLSEGANSSDIVYLEHQIEVTKEELQFASEILEKSERELADLKSSSVESNVPSDPSDDSDEQAIMEKSSQTRATMETLSTQLEQLEEALAKLGD